MIPSLRKSHRVIWMILPLVFPLLFWAAISGRPQVFDQATLYENTPAAFPKLIRSKDTPVFLINLRSEDTRPQQLEIVIKQPLLQAAATVYLLPQNQAKQILGTLGTTGIYRFPLPPSIEGQEQVKIEIVDILKNETLLTVDC